MDGSAPVLKIVALGSTSVGKTSIVQRFARSAFDGNETSTIGATSIRCLVEDDSGCAVLLDVWNTAGQERYRSLAPMYYHGSAAAIIVFSIAEEDALSDAVDWVDELREALHEIPALYLVGNKVDLHPRAVSTDQACATAAATGAKYFETSAKTGQGISDLFADIAAHARAEEIPARDPAVAGEEMTLLDICSNTNSHDYSRCDVTAETKDCNQWNFLRICQRLRADSPKRDPRRHSPARASPRPFCRRLR
jgi:small GTP-binding protein